MFVVNDFEDTWFGKYDRRGHRRQSIFPVRYFISAIV